MVKTAAILFGIVFWPSDPWVRPSITKDEMLLGIFHVNFAHNLVHLASGAVFLLCGMAGAGASSTFFQIFGVVYAAVAALGFIKATVSCSASFRTTPLIPSCISCSPSSCSCSACRRRDTPPLSWFFLNVPVGEVENTSPQARLLLRGRTDPGVVHRAPRSAENLRARRAAARRSWLR